MLVHAGRVEDFVVEEVTRRRWNEGNLGVMTEAVLAQLNSSRGQVL